MATIWQIAAGDGKKDLVPTMLEKGVMIIGPGDNVGDISLMDKSTLEEKCKRLEGEKSAPSTLIRFRKKAEEGQIVVLRLGSVCFAVGAIAGEYEWQEQFRKVYSYWNKNRKYDPEEDNWDLGHTRKVDWFVLNNEEALYHFRRGIYSKWRFSRVHDPKLHEYLKKKGYNDKNGKEILNAIGDRTSGVNPYGFPDK